MNPNTTPAPTYNLWTPSAIGGFKLLETGSLVDVIRYQSRDWRKCIILPVGATPTEADDIDDYTTLRRLLGPEATK